MKLLGTFMLYIIAANAVSDEEKWESFKDTHHKIYKSAREDITRFKIFQNNLKTIEEHNKKFAEGKVTYQLGVNKFADLTQNEFDKLWSMPQYKALNQITVFRAKKNVSGASSVDWREKGAVLDIQNQGQCGSCWAFSAAASVEGQNAIKHNTRISLSVQELVDCSREFGSRACKGGWMNYAYLYMKDHGISATADYKYEATFLQCRNSTAPRVNVTVTGFVSVDTNEEALRQAVENIGPVSVTLYGSYLHLYEKGIFDHEDCPRLHPTHAVLAVGYGSENGVDYWIMKNSWGKVWGENGYFRIVRNKNNTCGLCSFPMYPLIL